ncbi:hypothetical protein F4554_003032 [Actinopolymorpha rutila]|uniref:GrpB protein n=1 Tax=Actinopolymorpha rutila TaxID=446787 RepID=A0A852ZBV3_9ACTN|nr:hypothetical protein [Actinopolymorpha rutila]
MHVHVYEPSDRAVDDYLDLGGRLRIDESDRARYAATKRDWPGRPGLT